MPVGDRVLEAGYEYAAICQAGQQVEPRHRGKFSSADLRWSMLRSIASKYRSWHTWWGDRRSLPRTAFHPLPAAPFERLLRSRQHQLDLCPRVRVGIRRPVLRKLADGHDKQVFTAIAKHIRRALVYINEFSRCDIQHEDRIGNVLEDDAEAPLAFPQLALLMHALGDVDDCADEADHLPGLDRL